MTQPDLDRFTSRRSTVYAPNGVVATSQPLASQAGVSILQQGRNAFDAAVATAAALNVVEPTSTGLGGDVFALYRTADGDVGAMRSCGGAPAEATIENVRASLKEHDDPTAWYPENRGYAVDGTEDTDDLGMPFLGPHAVTVPGTARGWEATIERFGNLSLDERSNPPSTTPSAAIPSPKSSPPTGSARKRFQNGPRPRGVPEGRQGTENGRNHDASPPRREPASNRGGGRGRAVRGRHRGENRRRKSSRRAAS